ncbi:MAG: AAA family ATPase [Candidatus Thermoplasmatota archaeon]|nr:AAA family ATPase [Candidatus Thermoplasmatota archaeon]
MICITGPPKSGKTSICAELNGRGIECKSADRIAESLGCLEGGIVDIDCMNDKMLSLPRVIEGHYSHLLRCDYVIVLKTDPSVLEDRMRLAGYSKEKISENIDASEIGIFESEALERLPLRRIVTCDLTGMSIPESVLAVMNKIIEAEALTSKG